MTPSGYAYREALAQSIQPHGGLSHDQSGAVVSFGQGTQMGDSHFRDVAGRDIIHINLFPGSSAAQEAIPRLQPQQEQLLCEIVEASRNVPIDQREKFTFAWLNGSDRTVARLLRHPGFPNETRGDVYEGDLEELERAGLLALSPRRERFGQGSRDVDVTNRGYAYYDVLKSNGNL